MKGPSNTLPRDLHLVLGSVKPRTLPLMFSSTGCDTRTPATAKRASEGLKFDARTLNSITKFGAWKGPTSL